MGQAEDFCCGTPRNVERLSHNEIGAPGPRDRYDVGSHPASDYSSKELADNPGGTLAAHLVPGGTGGLVPRRGWGDTRGGTECFDEVGTGNVEVEPSGEEREAGLLGICTEGRGGTPSDLVAAGGERLGEGNQGLEAAESREKREKDAHLASLGCESRPPAPPI